MRSKYQTIHKLRSMFFMMAVCAVAGVFFESFTTGSLTLSGPLVGLMVGLPLALFEIMFPLKFMRGWSFAATVISKAFFYAALIWAAFMVSSFIYGFFEGLTLQDFAEEIWSKSTLLKVVVGAAVFIVIIFFRQLNLLLGPGTLARYIFGGYHHPVKEERIFMFLDIKESTSIAEKLDMERYYAFLNDFFHDISAPVLSADAQIYQYVGDEVVLTWPMATGLKNANCIRIFFEIDKAVKQRRPHYLAYYGMVPEYKAGVHGGEVIRAEIGDLKRDLIYNGDVLNTTARIQVECSRLNSRLLISSTLFRRLKLPQEISSTELGEIQLKGKRAPIGLVSLSKTEKLKTVRI